MISTQFYYLQKCWLTLVIDISSYFLFVGLSLLSPSFILCKEKIEEEIYRKVKLDTSIFGTRREQYIWYQERAVYLILGESSIFGTKREQCIWYQERALYLVLGESSIFGTTREQCIWYQERAMYLVLGESSIFGTRRI